ncbi:MAG: DNA-binding protein [Candidatus Omnitrophica bacterium]|nr:DNA-binding protein [Candidatus Omnitrophota bacterium]
MFKLKAKSAKRKVKVQNLKFLVLSFSFTLFALNLTLISVSSYAQSISSAELINNAKQYDGKQVVYEGEVIGDIMARGDYAWINVNDGANAIGIWIEKAQTKDILYSGSYKSKGDRVEVVGVFQRACLQHGGDLDIHAQSLRKISPGRVVVERLNLGKRNLIFVLLGILCLVWILRLLKTK